VADGIPGSFFDTRRSRVQPARAEIRAPGVVRVLIDDLDADGRACQWELPLAEVEISERVGSIPRRLTLSGIGVFETADNESIDRALAALGRSPGLVHWLEERWPVAIASLIAVAAGSLLFVRFGVPAIADLAARTLPVSVDRVLGTQTLELLDRILLDPSELPTRRQLELQQRFESMLPGPDQGRDDRLEFRAAPKLGPNALALPSGIVVMTDELVLLAEHDEELVAVLAHELGHVRGRHALRQLLQSAGVSAVAFALLGDVSSASALLSAVPVLIEAKHSRDFEREADAFAKRWLDDNAIPAHRFDDILCRMQSESGGDEDSPFARYLSTHPAADERMRCESESESEPSAHGEPRDGLDPPGPDQDGA
jgi:Zn-dependent protease with chaperone function